MFKTMNILTDILDGVIKAGEAELKTRPNAEKQETEELWRQ